MESFQDIETAFVIKIHNINRADWPMSCADETMLEIEAEYEQKGLQAEIARDKML